MLIPHLTTSQVAGREIARLRDDWEGEVVDTGKQYRRRRISRRTFEQVLTDIAARYETMIGPYCETLVALEFMEDGCEP